MLTNEQKAAVKKILNSFINHGLKQWESFVEYLTLEEKKEEYNALLTLLSQSKDFTSDFKARCIKRALRNQGTLLGYGAAPEGDTNKLYLHLTNFLFEPKSLQALFALINPRTKRQIIVEDSELKTLVLSESKPIALLDVLSTLYYFKDLCFDLNSLRLLSVNQYLSIFKQLEQQHSEFFESLCNSYQDFKALKPLCLVDDKLNLSETDLQSLENKYKRMTVKDWGRLNTQSNSILPLDFVRPRLKHLQLNSMTSLVDLLQFFPLLSYTEVLFSVDWSKYNGDYAWYVDLQESLSYVQSGFNEEQRTAVVKALISGPPKVVASVKEELLVREVVFGKDIDLVMKLLSCWPDDELLTALKVRDRRNNDTVMHLVTKKPDLLYAILKRVPQEHYATIIAFENRRGVSVLSVAAENTEATNMILSFLSLDQQPTKEELLLCAAQVRNAVLIKQHIILWQKKEWHLALKISDTNKNTVLHHLLHTTELLDWIVRELSLEHLLELLELNDNEGLCVIERAAKIGNSLKVLLAFVPPNKRPNPKTLLFYIWGQGNEKLMRDYLTSFTKKEVFDVFDSYFEVDKDDRYKYSMYRMLLALPNDMLFDVLMMEYSPGANILNYLLDQHHLTDTALGLLEGDLKLQALQNSNTNWLGYLSSVGNKYRHLTGKVILGVLSEEQREVLLSDSKQFEVFVACRINFSSKPNEFANSFVPYYFEIHQMTNNCISTSDAFLLLKDEIFSHGHSFEAIKNKIFQFVDENPDEPISKSLKWIMEPFMPKETRQIVKHSNGFFSVSEESEIIQDVSEHSNSL